MLPEPRNLLEQERSTGQGLLPGQALGQASLLDRSACWTVQPATQVSFPDRSALRIPRQVSLLDRSACWTGQPPWTSQLPRQASLLDRSARLDRSTFWTGQSPRQVSLAARSTSQTGHPFRQISLTNMSTSLISLLDRAAFQTGQSPRQVSFLDRSTSQTGHLPGQVSFQTSLLLVSLPDGAAFRQICVSFPDRWAYNTGQQCRLISQQ